MLLLVASSERLKLLHSPVLGGREQDPRKHKKCFKKNKTKQVASFTWMLFQTCLSFVWTATLFASLFSEGEMLPHPMLHGSREAAWRCVLPRADGCLQLINGLGRTAEKGKPAAGSTVMPIKHLHFFLAKEAR